MCQVNAQRFGCGGAANSCQKSEMLKCRALVTLPAPESARPLTYRPVNAGRQSEQRYALRRS